MSVFARKQKNKSFVTSMFIGLVIVMTINHLAATVVSLIDSYCISQYLGSSGLAAVSLIGPINQIVGAIAAMFSVGGQLIATKLLAKGENEKANKHFSTNIYFLFILGLIISISIFFASTPIAKMLSAGKSSEEVIKCTSQYLKGFVIGIPFLFLNEYFLSLVYLDNDKVRTTISVVVLFAVNAGLDFLFAEFFNNKAFGIGIASAISYIASSLVLLTHFLSKKSGFKFTFKSLSFSYIKDSFIYGIPVGVKNVVITIRLYLLNFLMLTIGSDLVIAAHGIEVNISNFFEAGLAGLISAVLMLGSVFYSEDDERCLNELLMNVFKFSIIVGGVLSIIYFFTSPYLASMMSKDNAVIEQATYAMRASSLALIFLTLAAGFLAFLQSCKKTLFANISTALQSLILPIAMVCILGFTLGVKGIWIGIPLGFVIYVILHFIFAFIKARKIKFDARTLFFLDKDFGYKSDEMYEKEINSIADTYSISQDVLDFCKKLNIDERRKQNLANCAEEMAVLIVISGFSKHVKLKATPHASIRVLYKKKTRSLLIRTRDNCEKFDIKEKIKKIKEGYKYDLALNCSIRMIVSMSKSIDYSQLLKTNNMIIKI